MDPATARPTFDFLDHAKSFFVDALNLNDVYEKVEYVPFKQKKELEGDTVDAKISLQAFLILRHALELKRIFSQSDKSKIMVLDPSLVRPFGRMVSAATLKEWGVKLFFSFDYINFDQENHHFVFFVPSIIKNIHSLANTFKQSNVVFHKSNTYSIYTVPASSLRLDSSLEHAGIFDQFLHIQRYVSNIFPLCDDLLSLELKGTLNAVICLQNMEPLSYMTDALSEIQNTFGKFRNVTAFGKHSLKIPEFLKRRPFEPLKQAQNISFARLTLIDRAQDLITPLLTPCTYSALMDEFIGISNNSITFDGRDIQLEADDEIYKKLESAHVFRLPKMISEELKKIPEMELEVGRLRQNDLLSASREAFRCAKKKEKLNLHLKIAEFLMKKFNEKDFQASLNEEQRILTKIDPEGSLDFIDELINKNRPITEVIRLFALYTQVYGKLEPKRKEDFYTSIIQTYGYSHFFTLQRIEQLGSLRNVNPGKARKKFDLIKEVDLEKDPTDIAYLYNGYAPLSCRLVESFMAKPMETTANGLELVCFVGGITRAELSACRLISDKIVVLTTEVFNRNSFLESFYGIQ